MKKVESAKELKVGQTVELRWNEAYPEEFQRGVVAVAGQKPRIDLDADGGDLAGGSFLPNPMAFEAGVVWTEEVA